MTILVADNGRVSSFDQLRQPRLEDFTRGYFSLPRLLQPMAKRLKTSNPEVAALMRQRKQLVPWRSTGYNDEVTLTELRDAHPAIEWGKLKAMFNDAVPQWRRRSMDSIKNKWRSLRLKSQTATQLAVVGPSLEDVRHSDTYSATV